MKKYSKRQLKQALEACMAEYPDYDFTKFTNRQLLLGSLGWLVEHEVEPEEDIIDEESSPN